VRKLVIISAAVAAPAILLGAAVPAFADTSPAPTAANHHALTADSDDADGGPSTPDGGASMPDSHHFDASSDDSDDSGNPWGDYSDVFGNSSSAQGANGSGGGGSRPSYPGNGPDGPDGGSGVTHGRLPLLGG